MSSRFLLALAAVLPALASPAHAQAAPTYAVLSLIGDQLDAVTYQPQIGTLLDSNTHLAMPMGAGNVLDTAALRATNSALRATVAVTDVALLATSAPAIYADESRFFVGDQVRLPADIETAVAQAKASRLVLITKHRGEAHLKTKHGFVGNGKIEGLGFYLDTVHRIHDEDITDRTVGFIAPFVYIDVTLVDTASHTVLRQTAITASETVMGAGNANGANTWGALSPEQKMAALNRLLSTSLAEVVPQLVQPSASAPPPGGIATR